jgi:transposase-like protein
MIADTNIAVNAPRPWRRLNRRCLMSDRELQRGPRDGLSGRVASPTDLPAPETRRWVARRKAQVVAAVRAGTITLEDACGRYGLSAEEFGAWEQAIDRHGPGALRVTRLQEFRHG